MAVLSNWMAEARHLETAGDLQAAVAVYQKALAKQAETAGFADLSLYNGLGDLYLRAGKRAEALEAYESAAQHCEDQQLYANGIALCKKILRNAPEHAPAYRRAARLSALSGLAAEARLHYASYREKLSDVGRGREALDSLQEIVEITADEESSVELGEALAELGELDRALELLRAVKARRQDEGRAVVILVRTIQELQQGAQTEEIVETASVVEPIETTVPVAPPSETTPPEQAAPPESFAELDTSEFGYSLISDVETEPEAIVEPVAPVEPPTVAEAEAEIVTELEPLAVAEVESDIAPPAEAEAGAEEAPPEPRFGSILEELDDEFSDPLEAPSDDLWETGSTHDPSLGAFGSTPAPELETPPAPPIEEPIEIQRAADNASPVADPMVLLLDRLNLVMSDVEGDASFQQALEVIDEMLSLEPGRFELLSRKLHYAFAIQDEAAAISAYLALGESLDRHLDGFTVRTLSSTTPAGSVTAAIQVEDVPGVAPGT